MMRTFLPLVFLAVACRTPEGADDTTATAALLPYQCPQAVASLQDAAPNLEASRNTISKAFMTCLREYISIDTTNAANQPANEGKAVAFLEEVYAAIGIPTRKIQVPDLSGRPGGAARTNLVASLLPPGAEVGSMLPSLLLMHHMDVVAAHPEQWQSIPGVDRPDLSGAIDRISKDHDAEDMMIGRGALDMKSAGIMHMIAMALYKFQGLPLKKAVHMLALADEEQNGSGAIGLLREINPQGQLPDLAQARVAFNEGGFGVSEVIGPESGMQFIGTDERGGAWLRLKNKNLQQLIEDLAALKLIPYQKSNIEAAKASFWQKVEGWRCKLNRFVTPGAKSNVVPSVVYLELVCDNNPSRDDLEWAFDVKEFAEILRNALGLKTETPPLKIEYESMPWGLKLRLATESSAHGSAATGMSALDIAMWGLEKIGALEAPASYAWPAVFDYQFSPTIRKTIDAFGKLDWRFKSINTADISNVSNLLDYLPESLVEDLLFIVGGHYGVEKLFRTSCSWTALTVPPAGVGVSEALLDCRLLNARKVAAGDQSHAQEFAEKIAGILNKNAKPGNLSTTVTLDNGWNYTSSSDATPYYKAVEAVLSEVFPNTVVTPFVTPGGTDSTYFRDPLNVESDADAAAFPEGLPSYGFTPAMVKSEVLSGFHGSNERFPLSQMYPAVKAYHLLLTRIAGTDL